MGVVKLIYSAGKELNVTEREFLKETVSKWSLFNKSIYFLVQRQKPCFGQFLA